MRSQPLLTTLLALGLKAVLAHERDMNVPSNGIVTVTSTITSTMTVPPTLPRSVMPTTSAAPITTGPGTLPLLLPGSIVPQNGSTIASASISSRISSSLPNVTVTMTVPPASDLTATESSVSIPPIPIESSAASSAGPILKTMTLIWGPQPSLDAGPDNGVGTLINTDLPSVTLSPATYSSIPTLTTLTTSSPPQQQQRNGVERPEGSNVEDDEESSDNNEHEEAVSNKEEEEKHVNETGSIVKWIWIALAIVALLVILAGITSAWRYKNRISGSTDMV
ncbi:hypothetical protein M501DRAFT_735460 [Patellaria atrata CBS 101060]|uniref:Mid2 domain-containing protein n=1 Tax=Patellaria atrata CBS 101060 TaxID=1346257 RepID=A0A9P4SC68_9PEZI|nr:hypothetical protein M501DRAFT_735460 [Patellaria atrata CBS 101060]